MGQGHLLEKIAESHYRIIGLLYLYHLTRITVAVDDDDIKAEEEEENDIS